MNSNAQGKVVPFQLNRNAEKLNDRIRRLAWLLCTENAEILCRISIERAQLERELQIFDFSLDGEKKSFRAFLGCVSKCILANIFLRRKLRRVRKEMRRLDQIERDATLHEKKLFHFWEKLNLHSLSFEQIHGILFSLEKCWFVQQLSEEERRRFVNFHLKSRIQNIMACMAELEVIIGP